MKLVNRSGNALMHNVFDNSQMVETYLLKVGEALDVPEDIAKLWLKIDGVEKCIEQEELDKAVQEALKKAKAEAKPAKAKAKSKAKAKK